jgi:F-type H+-transporting ATPase subunit a
MSYFFISSPLEQFEVTPLIMIIAPVLGDFVLAITNIGFYVIITIFLIMYLHIVANNHNRIIPNRCNIILETIYASVHSIVRDQIGRSHEIYLPLIYSLFWFLLLANLNGNIPYGYTVTTSAVACIGISLFIFISVTIIGLYIHGITFFSFFVPIGTPFGLIPILVLIETISYLARSASLGVRLFSNFVAGHTLLKILSTFLFKMFSASFIIIIITLVPFAVFTTLIVLEIAVSFIQAYVFCVLSCSYIKDAIQLH